LTNPVSVKLVPDTFEATAVVDSPPALVPRYTLYPVTADPPFDAGAGHDNANDPLLAAAAKDCGADGTVAADCGVADASFDCGEVPTEFTAATV
jgi:hypothetical protein